MDYADAKVQMGELRGLTDLLSDPSYKRWVKAEPALKRSIPLLIFVFLVTLVLIAVIHLGQLYESVLEDARVDLSLSSRMMSDDLRTPGANPQETVDSYMRSVRIANPSSRKMAVVSDAGGTIIASSRPGDIGRALGDIVQKEHPLLKYARRAGRDVHDAVGHGGAWLRAAAGSRRRPRARAAPRRRRVGALEAAGRHDHHPGRRYRLHHDPSRRDLPRADGAGASGRHDLQRGTAALRHGVDRGRTGLWDWDLRKGKLYWSASMLELLGYKPEEQIVTLDAARQLIHPQDMKTFRTTLAKAAAARHGCSTPPAARGT